jgi:hypothetical protein
MDIEMIMKLIQDNPELAQAMVSQLKGQGQQAQGELGTVANMPDDVRQGMGDIYSSPDMQKLMGEQRDMATARSKQPVGAGVGPYNAYVAPHWTQNLNAAGAQGREGMMQQKMMADLLRKKAGADKYNQYAQDQAKDLLAAQAAKAQYDIAGTDALKPPVRPEEQWLERGYDPLTGDNYTPSPPAPVAALPPRKDTGPIPILGADPTQNQSGYGPYDPLRPRPQVTGNKMTPQQLAELLKTAGPQLGKPQSSIPSNPFGWMGGGQ